MSKGSALWAIALLGAGAFVSTSEIVAHRTRGGTGAGSRDARTDESRPAEESPTFELFGLRLNRLWIPFWPCSERTVHDSSSSTCAWTKPPTLEDLEAFNRAMACGDPVPPGFPRPGHERRTIARTTGAVDWFGRHEVQLRVTDAAVRLDSAKLYLDDDLVGEASVDDGGIVVRGDEAEATFRFFLPWIPHFRVTLIADDRDGQMEESWYSIGRRL